MNKKLRVLFVCTGNICRSPLAEGYLRHLCETNGYSKIETDSAGISALRGSPPSKEATAVAEDWGFDISMLKSRQFSKSDLTNFDLILTMTVEQRKWIIENYKANAKRIRLLRELSATDGESLDISDPIGLGISSYMETFRYIKKSVENLLEQLKTKEL